MNNIIVNQQGSEKMVEQTYEISYEHQLMKDAYEARERNVPLNFLVTVCPPYSFKEEDGKYNLDFKGELMSSEEGRVARTALAWPVAYSSNTTE